jgi:translation initiation factor 3 subunit J
MENWEEEKAAVSPVPVAAADKWAGEDEDDDVKDNWDDEDEEPKSESVSDDPKPAAASKKKALAKKIAEKEEQARLKANSRPLTAEEQAADKLEKLRLQQESDLRLAQEAFGLGDANAAGLDALPLSSTSDFDNFKKVLISRLQAAERSPHYVPFLENTIRDICASLDPEDIKRISSNLNTLWNEKVKASKGPKAKKGKAKGAIKVERTAMDYDGNDIGDDFDDFM